MHAVRVSRSKRNTRDEELSEEACRLAEPFLVAEAPALAEGEEDLADSVAFSAGNPRVEHITGVVHLYRHIPPGAADDPVALPEDRGDRLCVLSLPSEIGVAEFCAFVGGYLPQLREMRFVRKEGGRALCLVLLRFADTYQADSFFADYNAKPFSSLEPDVLCRLVYVQDVEIFSSEDSKVSTPPAGQTELPTCPVCLERLDQHISGVVTTVCNHKFHNECLQRWGDTSCPVCRYCANANASSSHCSTCGTTQDLWICLICGHVGCGRYREGHAIDHWKGSDHCYALDLETQRVWDYISDGYVHRLVQSKTDGKLVEVPSPAPHRMTGSGRATREPDSCSSSQAGGGRRGEGEEDMEEAMLASKMDHIALEYNHLLVSQLDSQRAYYEALVRKHDAEAQALVAAAERSVEKSGAEAQAAAAQALEADRARRTAERKLTDVAAKAAKLEKECDFLKQLNESLLRNQKEFQDQAKAMQAGAVQDKQVAAVQIVDLEQQVRDLLFFVEARQKIDEEGGTDLQEGTVLPVPKQSSPPPVTRRRGSGRKR